MCENNIKKLIQDSIANRPNRGNFYITKDNSDGTKETVYRLKCNKEQALKIFHFVIEEQQKEYRNSNYTIKWRIIRMFDSKTDEQICQES